MLLAWEQGRQNSGYWKCLLAQVRPYFDCYLLKYPQGSQISRHQDPVTDRRHYRLNIVLWKAAKGGVFSCENPLLSWGRVVLFRSDTSPHEVTLIEKGCRYVLSFGWTLAA